MCSMSEGSPQFKSLFTKVTGAAHVLGMPSFYICLLVYVAEPVCSWAHSVVDGNIRRELELHQIVKRRISGRGNYISF